MKRIPAAALSVLCILAFWQIASGAVGSALVLPGIPQVAKALRALCTSREFWVSVGMTFLRCMEATLIAVTLGLLAGFLMHKSEGARTFLALPLWIVKATPVVALVLIALFWFKASHIPVFVATLLALPVTAAATEKGCAAYDRQIVQALRRYGLSESQLWRTVKLPAAKPFLSQGISSAYGLVWKAVAAGEVLSLPKHGLGTMLSMQQVHLETASVLATTIALIAAGFTSELLFSTAVKAAQKRRSGNHLRSWKFRASGRDAAAHPHAERIQEPDLSAGYGDKKILDGFSFTAEAGSVTAIIAQSGAGKTTLLSALSDALHKKKVPVSSVYQEPRLVPHLTLKENVCLPLCSVMGRDEALSRTEEILSQVGLKHLSERLPSEVSGGERQRASLARAFAYPSGVLLMDEAFQSQDIAIECRLIELLCSLLERENRTVVLATHNVREACVLSDRLLVLKPSPLRTDFEKKLPGRGGDSAARYKKPDAAVLADESAVHEALLS